MSENPLMSIALAALLTFFINAANRFSVGLCCVTRKLLISEKISSGSEIKGAKMVFSIGVEVCGGLKLDAENSDWNVLSKDFLLFTAEPTLDIGSSGFLNKDILGPLKDSKKLLGKLM